MENRIKEQQLGLFADRTSAATMRANQLRLYLSSAAYMLMHALRRLGLKADPPGSRSVSDDSLEAPEDRRPSPPHGPPRLDLHVGSLSLQRGLRCRRSKPPGHSSALLRSVPIKRPQKRNRSTAQAELCLNTFRHALPNPKNAPFTTIHTTASLDLDRIDSETLRKTVPACQNHLHFQLGDLCGLVPFEKSETACGDVSSKPEVRNSKQVQNPKFKGSKSRGMGIGGNEM